MSGSSEWGRGSGFAVDRNDGLEGVGYKVRRCDTGTFGLRNDLSQSTIDRSIDLVPYIPDEKETRADRWRFHRVRIFSSRVSVAGSLSWLYCSQFPWA